ncbi:MAG: translation elongation factor Ts [Actinobacteria bacterium]|nr:translation elongation factor Ts [Actinomycetota bacterium]
MAEISAKDVAALRKETGAGMMDCKKALEESGGDMAAAKTWLREKGLAGASKRAGREASDGAVEVLISESAGVVVEVNCETDFVAKGDEFVGFVGDLAQFALEAAGVSSADDLAAKPFGDGTVEDAVKALGAKVGENVSLGRVVRVEPAGGLVDGYKHVQNDRGVIGVLVELEGVESGDEKSRQVAHDLALHIASAAPRWLRREDVPDDVISAERDIYENMARNEGKPEQALPKVVEGRLAGFFKDNVLLEQGFVREPKRTVASLVDDLGGPQIRSFARVQVGER